jgi:PST family polysaccharide transporter
MQRELQFEKRAYALIGSSITTLFVSIVLALKGLSYWALAWGSLAGSISSVIILFVCSSFRPGRWTGVENVKSLLRFGANVTAFDFINYFHRNTDSILIGKFWGSEVLGLYGRAYQILMFPLSRLRGPISSVAFPVLSKLVNEPENYCRYYRKIIYLLAVTSMPLMAFLFVSSEEFIETAFGANWLEAAPIFSFLAVTGFIQPVASLRGMVFLSTGQSKRYLYWGIINALFVTAAFMLGVVWGAVGVAVSYAAINYLLLLPSLSYAFRKSPLTLLDFFKPIAMPAFSSLCAIACCMASREFFGWFSSTEAWLRLLGMAVFYALIYMSILLIFPTSRRDVVRTSAIFREIKRGKKEA